MALAAPGLTHDHAHSGLEAPPSDLLGSDWHGVDTQSPDVARGAHIDSQRDHRRRTARVRPPLEQWGWDIEADPLAQTWSVRLTARTDIYVRLWWTHLCIIALSLGLLYPWTRVRERRHLYAHVWIADRALRYQGHAAVELVWFWTRCGGLAALAFLAWRSRWQGGMAFALLLAAWPAAAHFVQRYRLSHTFWHHAPLGCGASRLASYATHAPALALLLAPVVWCAPTLAAQRQSSIASWALASPGAQTAWGLWLGIIVLLAPLYVWGRIRLTHHHLSVARQRLDWVASWPAVYGVCARAALLAMVMLALEMFFAAATVAVWHPGAVLSDGLRHLTLPVRAALLLIAAAPPLALAWPYAQAQLQSIAWGRMGNLYVRVGCEAPTATLISMHLTSFLLCLFTLGLYLPFARLRILRARLQALRVTSRLSAQALRSTTGMHRAIR